MQQQQYVALTLIDKGVTVFFLTERVMLCQWVLDLRMNAGWNQQFTV